MTGELYQAETNRICNFHQAILDEARDRLRKGDVLSPMEQQGVIHSLQVLIENAIGKAKQWLKARGESIPASAYDSFERLVQLKQLDVGLQPQWAKAVGLRNNIVHDYMNLDVNIINHLIREGQYGFILEFLRAPIYE